MLENACIKKPMERTVPDVYRGSRSDGESMGYGGLKMDWIIDCARTWGHILVGVGLLGMILVAAHQVIEWYRLIQDDNEGVRK